MFAESVPVALRALERAQFLHGKTPPDTFAARLAPGMFDVQTQFFAVAGFALRATYPLAGRGVPVLQGDAGARLAQAQSWLSHLTEADFTGAERRVITHRAGFADLEQAAAVYLRDFALPNLWFHLSMAYAGLRAAGVALGKADFDGLHAYPDGFTFDD